MPPSPQYGDIKNFLLVKPHTGYLSKKISYMLRYGQNDVEIGVIKKTNKIFFYLIIFTVVIQPHFHFVSVRFDLIRGDFHHIDLSLAFH